MLGQIYSYVRERLEPVYHRFTPRRHQRPRFQPPPCQPAREALPLSRADHWARTAGVLSAAISGLDRIRDAQVRAARQIDAAEYSLQHLLEELSAVMPLPADGAPLRAILAEAAPKPAAADRAVAA